MEMPEDIKVDAARDGARDREQLKENFRVDGTPYALDRSPTDGCAV
jgi:hypothetical protein